VHVAVPLAHDSFPLWQGLDVGVQVPPSLHATQAPALQTMPVIPAGEQFVPAGLFPVSTQTCVPVVHEYAPVLQTLVGWQTPFGVQATHIPPRQILLVPHTSVPSATDMVVSVQTAAPVSHANVPL
jgi:hypothetical protein